MARIDATRDGFISLPTEIILAVISLLDAKDIIRVWRVSKTWNHVFRSEKLCKPALKAILEDTCLNLVADRSAAEQLAYHGHRLHRFYDSDPCGTTKIYIGEKIWIGRCEEYQPDVSYHDGKIAWLDEFDENGREITRINVLSLLEGFILRRKPGVTTLGKVGLSSSLVAVTSGVNSLSENGICFVWNLETGEERSFKMFSFTRCAPEMNDGLVLLRDFKRQDRRTLIWSFERNASYVVYPQVPAFKGGIPGRSHTYSTGDAIYHFDIYICHLSCASKDVILGGNSHEPTMTFHCSKFSITDGSLLSYRSKSIRTSIAGKLYTVRQITPVNREGLLSYHLSTSGDEVPLFGSRSELESEDDYSLLLCLFQYDTRTDEIVIQKRGCIVSRFLLTMLQEYSINFFSWKETVHVEAMWSMIDVAFRARLDNKRESKVRMLKYRDIRPHRCGFLFSVNDVCVVGYEDNNFVVRWYDQLAYERARRVSDASGLE